MDYEKKYEDALERAKMSYHTGDYDKDTLEMLEIIFPELKESEDEKVRKAILELVRQSSEVLEKKNQERMLAWLEKQGEQKPQRMISAEAKEAMYDKPAWREEDKDVINNLLAICNGAKKFIQFESCSREDIIKCQDWLKSLKQRIGG